jgi:hypothetical protein
VEITKQKELYLEVFDCGDVGMTNLQNDTSMKACFVHAFVYFRQIGVVIAIS